MISDNQSRLRYDTVCIYLHFWFVPRIDGQGSVFLWHLHSKNKKASSSPTIPVQWLRWFTEISNMHFFSLTSFPWNKSFAPRPRSHTFLPWYLHTLWDVCWVTEYFSKMAINRTLLTSGKRRLWTTSCHGISCVRTSAPTRYARIGLAKWCSSSKICFTSLQIWSMTRQLEVFCASLSLITSVTTSFIEQVS